MYEVEKGETIYEKKKEKNTNGRLNRKLKNTHTKKDKNKGNSRKKIIEYG